PKSSLDGNRESVIPKDVSGDAEKMYKWYKAKAGEQLSGVDLLKRLGKAGEEQNFSSTSHMAAMPLKTHLQAKASDTAVQQKWADYLAVLRTINSEIEKQEVIRHRLQLPIIGNLDGGLLFKSRLLDYMDKADTRKAEDKLNDFLKALLRDAKVKELIPYYALLVGDGDFMGRTINSLEKPEEHRNFSAALAGFASKAKGIVAEHDGAAVFTGGDDVLALLPMHQAIQCAAELAATFQKTMKEAVKVGDPPTFSAGIAIFHHTEPLEDALQTAREAEQTAKGIKDKNALAVTEAKRSGAPRTVQGKWGKLDKRLLDLAAFFQAGALPSGLAYQLRDMYLHLGGQEAMKAGLKDVLAAEAGRIIKRKEGTTAAQAYVEKRVEQLGEGYTISQIAHELIIAANLAKAAEQAGMDLEKERA
ncbi:MAG: type III-B CRISPR-associated protein Cas10/Cmr2, partial [Anaerolineae bacterium]